MAAEKLLSTALAAAYIQPALPHVNAGILLAELRRPDRPARHEPPPFVRHRRRIYYRRADLDGLVERIHADRRPVEAPALTLVATTPAPVKAKSSTAAPVVIAKPNTVVVKFSDQVFVRLSPADARQLAERLILAAAGADRSAAA